MTTTVRASSPADLAVLLPYQLGYHPGPSLVVVVVHDRRLGLMQRHDLPPEGPACEAMARHALEIAGRERPTGLLLLAYEDEPGESEPLRRAVVKAAASRAVPVGQQVLVRGRRWWSVERGRPRPELGLPLPAPEDVPGVAAFVAAGVAPFASREALVAGTLPTRDEARAARVGRALAREEPGRAASRHWQRLLDPGPDAVPVAELSDTDIARVLASLADVALRDALMATLAPGTMPLASLPGPAHEDALVAAARCPWTGIEDVAEMEETGHEGLQTVRARLVEVTRLVPEVATPDLLALIAHLAWFVGDGTVTAVCLEQALDVDPEHRLSQLMLTLLGAGVRPWSVPGAA